jgi:hypothetical protein
MEVINEIAQGRSWIPDESGLELMAIGCWLIGLVRLFFLIRRLKAVNRALRRLDQLSGDFRAHNLPLAFAGRDPAGYNETAQASSPVPTMFSDLSPAGAGYIRLREGEPASGGAPGSPLPAEQSGSETAVAGHTPLNASGLVGGLPA